jgi:hypothetical protein
VAQLYPWALGSLSVTSTVEVFYPASTRRMLSQSEYATLILSGHAVVFLNYLISRPGFQLMVIQH